MMEHRQTRSPATLPTSEPVHFFAGHGHGLCCAACGSVISRNDLEYEIEYATPLRTVRMHARCYELFEAERAEADSSASPPAS